MDLRAHLLKDGPFSSGPTAQFFVIRPAPAPPAHPLATPDGDGAT